MVLPQEVKAAGGDSYRLDRAGSLLLWMYLVFAGAVAYVFPPAGFVLLPLALAFVRLNPYRFLILWIASSLFFFETYRSTFLVFAVPDALVFTYAALLILFALPKDLSLRVPVNTPLVFLYLQLLLIAALTPRALAADHLTYVVFDLKIALVMACIPAFLMFEGKHRQPKKIYLALLAVILFSTLHALEIFLGFVVSGGVRPTTWAGIFLSSSIVFSAVFLRLPLRSGLKWGLRAAMTLCALGLLVTQTRALWGSTLLGLTLFYLFQLVRMRRGRLKFVLRIAVVVAVIAFTANLAFIAITGDPAMVFLARRSSDTNWLGLLDPYSSLGYRLHESWAVWDERSFWGHGPGATINLFFTQMDKSEFMDWWSIHSGYFEYLHKYGFVGVFLLLGLGVSLAWRAGRSPFRGSAGPRRWDWRRC